MKRSRAHAYIKKAIETLDETLESEALTPIGPMSRDQLQWFRNLLLQMLDDVENNRAPDGKSGMGHIIADSWPLDAPLSEPLLAAEQAYMEFGKETRKHSG
ncbi:MAG: hypothetical protein RBT47_04950 [Anaerolineae bacterium]|jgi:hypothetical protein|nr:hypothetical protein [Anaerolineae bacterium]